MFNKGAAAGFKPSLTRKTASSLGCGPFAGPPKKTRILKGEVSHAMSNRSACHRLQTYAMVSWVSSKRVLPSSDFIAALEIDFDEQMPPSDWTTRSRRRTMQQVEYRGEPSAGAVRRGRRSTLQRLELRQFRDILLFCSPNSAISLISSAFFTKSALS